MMESEAKSELAGEKNSGPIFLVGAERSGSTLVRLMLDHHSHIRFVGEFEYAVDFMTDADTWPDMDAYAQWLSTDRIFQVSGLALKPGQSYAEQVRGFLDQFHERSGKPIIGATVHRHFDRLLKIWPNARFIHLIRDPRDVARSRIQMGWEGSFWHASQVWVEAEQLWEQMAPRLPESRRIDLKYENLLAEPEAELSRICNWMNIQYDPGMLDYHEQTTYQSPDPSLCYQWRRRISPIGIQQVEAVTGALLTSRGYEPSGLPPLRVTKLSKGRLAVQNRLGKLQSRVKRHGWRLWAQDVVSRRLPAKAWQKQVRLRMNSNDQKRVK